MSNDKFKKSIQRFIDRINNSTKIDSHDITYINNDCGYNNLVIFENISCLSFCEHHLTPVIYNIKVGYLPKEKLLGLGSVLRIVENCSNKPSLQEKVSVDIVNDLLNLSDARAVMVLVKGTHFCSHVDVKRQQEINIITTHYAGDLSNDVISNFFK